MTSGKRFPLFEDRMLYFLVVLLVFSSLFSDFLIINSLFENPPISGLAYTAGNVHMCILTKNARYRFEDPLSYEVIRSDAHGNYMFNLSKIGSATPSGENFTYMIKYARLGSQQNLLGVFQGEYGAPNLYPTVNLSALEDGNCEYAFYYYSTTDEHCSDVAIVNHVTIDNDPRPPIWENFKNENTTNFTSYGVPPDFWTAVPNAVISHPIYGSLNFSPYSLNFDSANLDKGIVFSDKALNFTSLSSPCLNFPATLTLKNVSYYYPSLEKDGVDCIANGACSFISYNRSSGIFKVKIPGFGYYRAVESATPQLELWDDNDPKRGNLNKSINEPINFFANLTVEGEVLKGDNVSCNFSIKNEDMEEVAYGNLSFNLSSQLYTFQHIFDTPGLYEWTVFCSADALGLGNVTSSDNISVRLSPVSFSYWTDLDEKGGSQIKYAKQPLGFYAEYFDRVSHTPIHGVNANCTLSLTNLSQGIWDVESDSQFLILNYSAARSRYETNFTFQYPGRYPYQIHCQDYPSHEDAYGTGQVYIPNRLPLLIATIPNVTLQQGRSTKLFSLSDYFIDPDGELLTFSSTYNPYVDIRIEDDGSVIFRASASYSGKTFVTFFAHDHTDIPVPSNEITITILKSEQRNATSGRELNVREERGYPLGCIERWSCSEWSPCYPSGFMFRTCYDEHKCGTLMRKPREQIPCNYTGTCFDGIKNQGEEGVDCGGPCPPCPNCSDGIQNQGEEGVDCGGPCPPCPSCFDGIQNQGEEGVDCGGPCPPCGILERPALLRTPLNDYISEITVVSAFFLAIIFIVMNFWKEFWLLARKLLFGFAKLIKSYSFGFVSIADIDAYIMKNLAKIRKGIGKENNKVLLNKLFSLYRFFLKYIFNLKFEFTLDELKAYLKTTSIPSSKKTILIAYFKTLQERLYGHRQISHQALERLISLFEKILRITSDIISKADLIHQEEEIIKKINLFPWRRKYLNKKLRLEIQAHIIKHLAYLREALDEGDEVAAAEEFEMTRVLVYLLPRKYRKRFVSKLHFYKDQIEHLIDKKVGENEVKGEDRRNVQVDKRPKDFKKQKGPRNEYKGYKSNNKKRSKNDKEK